jgi:hypothetical protein
MKRRLVALAVLAVFRLAADVQLSIVSGNTETPVGQAIDIGVVEMGDSVSILFRLRNPGPFAARLDQFEFAGTDFDIQAAPKLPLTFLPGAFLDFTVHFQPSAPGLSSATLRVNTASVIVLARVQAAATVLLDSSPLAGGTVIDFGAVERGRTAARGVALENRTAAAIGVPAVTLTGAAFSLSSAPAFPLQLAPGARAAFQVVFTAPDRAGAAQGEMRVGARAFPLRATVVDPPLPRPVISLSGSALGSAQQAKLSIRFTESPRSNGAGQLRLEFTGAADPAIQFLAPAGRSIPFTVTAGEDTARFAGRTEVEFQTGTTAGTLLFTAQAGSWSEQAAVQVTAAVVGIDSGRATRTASGIDLRVTGYDNTRTASQLEFVFYDSAGNTLGAPVRAGAAAEFHQYFNTSDLGGVFALGAMFPVTGDRSRIAAVEIAIINSAGTTVKRLNLD